MLAARALPVLLGNSLVRPRACNVHRSCLPRDHHWTTSTVWMLVHGMTSLCGLPPRWLTIIGDPVTYVYRGHISLTEHSTEYRYSGAGRLATARRPTRA
jgi:hypothetical protein